MNKALLIGNVGNTPEIRNTQNGTSVANLRLATHEFKKKDGQRVEYSEWHRLVFFGKLADIIAKYVSKGDKLYVEGRIETRKWTDKDGVGRYTTEIKIKEIEFLTPKDKAPVSYTPDDGEVGYGGPIETDVPF